MMGDRIISLTVAVDCPEIAKTLPHNVRFFTRSYVVTSPEDLRTQETVKGCGAQLVLSSRAFLGGDSFNKGRLLNDGLEALLAEEKPFWVVFLDADVALPDYFSADLFLHKNRRCLYYAIRTENVEIWPRLRQKPDPVAFSERRVAHRNKCWGFFQAVWSETIVEKFGRWSFYPEVFCSACSVDKWFLRQWSWGARSLLLPGFVVLHHPHGAAGTRWNHRGSKGGWAFFCQGTETVVRRQLARLTPPVWVRRVHQISLVTETHLIEFPGQWPFRTLAPPLTDEFEYDVWTDTVESLRQHASDLERSR